MIRRAGGRLLRLVVEFFFFLFRALPERMVRPLGVGLGFFLHRVVRFRRRKIVERLTFAFPEFDEENREALLRRIYTHFGLLIIELLRLPRQSDQDLTSSCVLEGRENLEKALAKGRGVLVLSGHLGNWEVGLAAASAFGFKVAAVTKEIKSDPGQYIADRLRHSHGVVSINRHHALRPILTFLKEGGCVGFVLDQNTTVKEGVFVDFFGRKACTMPGLAILARRYHVPVVGVSFYRDASGRHHLSFTPEFEWESEADVDNGFREGNEVAIKRNTQKYTSFLEREIRKHPEQWLWMHGRWRTRPES